MVNELMGAGDKKESLQRGHLEARCPMAYNIFLKRFSKDYLLIFCILTNTLINEN
jgi:hypothetical protein